MVRSILNALVKYHLNFTSDSFNIQYCIILYLEHISTYLKKCLELGKFKYLEKPTMENHGLKPMVTANRVAHLVLTWNGLILTLK